MLKTRMHSTFFSVSSLLFAATLAESIMYPRFLNIASANNTMTSQPQSSQNVYYVMHWEPVPNAPGKEYCVVVNLPRADAERMQRLNAAFSSVDSIFQRKFPDGPSGTLENREEYARLVTQMRKINVERRQILGDVRSQYFLTEAGMHHVGEILVSMPPLHNWPPPEVVRRAAGQTIPF